MSAPTSDEVRYINFSFFPAAYSVNDGAKSLNEQLKIIATDSHLLIYADKEQLLLSFRLMSFEKIDRSTYKVYTTEGEVITVHRENNCGCGNQLRGWNPYIGKPHIAHYPYLKGT